jgi:hypothetical protein
MDEDIKINQIRPYPPKGDENGRSKKRTPGEADEEEERNPREGPKHGEPEVQDGHIDTRVSPL